MAVKITTDTNTVKIAATTVNSVKIVGGETRNLVTVSQPTTKVVKVATQGPQGPPRAAISTGSFATTGSNTFVGNQIISGSLETTQGITGSLEGTASFASTASFAVTASFALTASFATNNYPLSNNPAGYLTSSSIADTITDGVTTIAPSQNAVFDALATLQTQLNNSLISQIKLTTAVSITTLTVDGSSLGQNGRTVTIDNGANAINITTDTTSEASFVSSYMKFGASAITFVAGAGTTLVQVDGTAILNGAVGSTATLQRVNNAFYLRVSNV